MKGVVGQVLPHLIWSSLGDEARTRWRNWPRRGVLFWEREYLFDLMGCWEGLACGKAAYLRTGEMTHGGDEMRVDDEAVELEEDILGDEDGEKAVERGAGREIDGLVFAGCQLGQDGHEDGEDGDGGEGHLEGEC